MSLDHLIVKPAGDAQVSEAILRNVKHWAAGAGVPPEELAKRCATSLNGPFAQNGKSTTWVFVPEDDPDTTNFYVSCEVLAREVLILQPGQTSPSTGFGHVITYVYVPPAHRGKGYAERFMMLMHSVLAPHRYPNPSKVSTVIDNPSTVSVLYSVVGDYYSRCAPREGESGWTLQASDSTIWSSSNVQTPQGTPLYTELLSESDVPAVLDADDPNIPTDMLELQKKDPTKTYFAFGSTATLNHFSIAMGKLIREDDNQTCPSWGVRIPGKADFMTWAHFVPPNLIVTRLRATAETFPVLLNVAIQAARDADYEGVEIWNVPEHLVDIVQATGGETARQEEDLAACKWYGQQSDTKVDDGDVIWAVNERYGWC